MMAWAQVEHALDGILARRWYTNHGPMAQELEWRGAIAFGAGHAIAVTNPAIGLIMMAESLALSGEVLLSALAPPRCAQSILRAGLQPRFCDVDPRTLGITPELARRRIGRATRAVMASPGGECAELAAMATVEGLAFYADGQDGRPFGPALAVLPCLGEDAGAACILTDDNHLAARLRNIRSSYGAGPTVSVARTANGRMSEAQAAMALITLEAAHCKPAPSHMPGWLWLEYGNEFALIGGSGRERDRLLGVLSRAGQSARTLALHPLAENCPVAAEIAASGLVLQRDSLAAAIAICTMAGEPV